MENNITETVEKLKPHFREYGDIEIQEEEKKIFVILKHYNNDTENNIFIYNKELDTYDNDFKSVYERLNKDRSKIFKKYNRYLEKLEVI